MTKKKGNAKNKRNDYRDGYCKRSAWKMILDKTCRHRTVVDLNKFSRTCQPHSYTCRSPEYSSHSSHHQLIFNRHFEYTGTTQIFKRQPGQQPVLQMVSLVDNPGQDAPPQDGGGFEQTLLLFWVPPPQLALQDSLVHSPQPPSTAASKILPILECST